jgi:hypothetical protein
MDQRVDISEMGKDYHGEVSERERRLWKWNKGKT